MNAKILNRVKLIYHYAKCSFFLTELIKAILLMGVFFTLLFVTKLLGLE
jgi:hypothetical protein